LGEKFTQLDNWQEDKFTEVITQLYQDLEMKEQALKKLQEVIQETKKSPSISIAESSTMTKLSMVNKPFKTLPQEAFGDLEKNTRSIDSKLFQISFNKLEHIMWYYELHQYRFPYLLHHTSALYTGW